MIKVKIITPFGLYKETEASIINIVTTEGQRGILPNHMPIVTMLVISRMSMQENDVREEYTIAEGMFYFKDNSATILVDAIENVKDIDIERAVRAKERAEKRLSTTNSGDVDYVRAELALKKALNRIGK